jgi:hypothetical protein
VKVVRALATKARGLTRNEVAKASGITSGGGLTKILEELELSGFVRSCPNFSTNENLVLYQLIDFFSIFSLRFMQGAKPKNPRFWTRNQDDPALSAWRGYAFERICLLHAEQIKKAIGVASISTETSSWRSRVSSPGAQIDLLIDRKDGVINLCEDKYSHGVFTVTADYEKRLRNKLSVFEAETGTKKAVHLTMVTTYGVKQNRHVGLIQSEATLDDLFA